jgi:hypothetical protein
VLGEQLLGFRRREGALMWVAIRDLDFNYMISIVKSSVDVARRTATDPLITDMLQSFNTPQEALEDLWIGLLLALRKEDLKTLDEITIDRPVVEAMLRTSHHPNGLVIPSLGLFGAEEGPDTAPRFRQLSAKHSDLEWDINIVYDLLIGAMRTNYGELQVDDALEPWLRYWDTATGLNRAITRLAVLEKIGILQT